MDSNLHKDNQTIFGLPAINFQNNLTLQARTREYIIKMSKVKVEEPVVDHTIQPKVNSWEDRLKDSELFVRSNTRLLSIVGGGVLGLIVLFFAYTYLYMAPRAKEAAGQMFKAEAYFEADSLTKAVNGDGNNPGFESIINDYGNTPSANLAHYYLGSVYLRQGDYQKAIDQLEKYGAKDDLSGSEAQGMIGDAYSELKNYDQALSYYLKAADNKPNIFTTPMYLQKAGLVYEYQKDYTKALDTYTRIKKDYSASSQSRDIDKFIARVQQH